MENRIFNTEQYLQKNKPERPTEESEESAKKLMEPAIKIDYENQDSAHLEKGSDSLEINFTTLDEETRDTLQGFVGISGKDYIASRTDVSKWRELTKFNISRKDSNTPILDLIKTVPPDYKVLFFPQNEFVNACAVRSDNHKFILYVGDISAEVVTPVLLHEIGHVIDFSKLNNTNDNKLVTDSKFQEEAEKLRKERVASAFALKILRPRFKDNSLMEKESSINFLKTIALNTYHEDINSLLHEKDFWGMHKGYWEKSGRHLQADEDLIWQQIEANDEYEKELVKFENIKQTNEYKEWRSKRSDDWEYDQMHKWDEWLEFLQTKQTEEFIEWKKLPENSIIVDEEQEREKFEDDKYSKFCNENGISLKRLKDILE